MSSVATSPSASTNLRDFLLLKDDDIGSAIHLGHLSTDYLTVNNTLTAEKLCGSPSSHVSRTLLDIIRSEEVNRSPSSSGSGSGGNLYSGKDKKSRRSFKEMIRTQVTRIGNTSFESSTGPSRLITRSEFSSLESSREMSTGNGGVVLEGENDRGGVERGPAAARYSSTPFGLLVPILIESDHQPDGVARDNLVGGSELTGSLNRSSREEFVKGIRGKVPTTARAREFRRNEVLVPQMEETSQQPVLCLSAALAEERDLSAREVLANEEAGGGQSSRMSLMDLLEETDRQMGCVFRKYPSQQDERKDEISGVGEANNCCVCMVRHKGAAFIPCGHTFCRLCSRELWVSRGACPICNGFILEILDIF